MNRMYRSGTYSRYLMWFMALTLSVLAAGCGGGGSGGGSPILGIGADSVASAAVAPTVIATSPSAIPVATGVALNRKLTATFSKDMTAATITSASTFTVACPAGTAVAGTVTYVAASRTATLAHAANFPVSTNCTATISTAAQDSTGVALAAPFVWTFTTGATADTTAPYITTTGAADGDINLPINRDSTATFSEPMDAGTLSSPATSFTVTLFGSAVAIPGTVSYIGNTATFHPTSSFLANTKYTSTVSNLATDLAGNALVAGVRANPWSWTTGATADTTPPTVTLTNPADVAVGVCLNKTVNATFSEAMRALTITAAGSFTLQTSGPPLGAALGASVSYDAATNVATLTPTAALLPSTNYTATITTAVQDVAGNALAVNKVWTFTTGTGTCQLPVPLGSSSNFAILASAAITNIPTSIITGDVGLTPDTGANITGFSSPLTCPEVTGKIYAVDAAGPGCIPVAQQSPVILTAAKTAALAAFTDARAAVRGTPIAITTNLTGMTLYPGLYESGTTIDFSAAGTLFLDAQGDPNAVFIIRSANAITTLGTSQVVLSGSAKATNVFWIAGSAITLGTNSIMKGTLIAATAITLQTGANLEGRALNQGPTAAAITCDKCTITVPLP